MAINTNRWVFACFGLVLFSICWAEPVVLPEPRRMVKSLAIFVSMYLYVQSHFTKFETYVDAVLLHDSFTENSWHQ